MCGAVGGNMCPGDGGGGGLKWTLVSAPPCCRVWVSVLVRAGLESADPLPGGHGPAFRCAECNVLVGLEGLDQDLANQTRDLAKQTQDLSK